MTAAREFFIESLHLEIIEKGTRDRMNRPYCELRVFVSRPDDSFDRIGTLSGSFGRVASLCEILEAGARAVGTRATVGRTSRAPHPR